MSFISLAIIAAAAVLLAIVTLTHRDTHKRTLLLWGAVITLATAVVARELIDPIGHVPWLDLLKRLALIASEAFAVLLVFSFRASPRRRLTPLVWSVATGLALLQISLLHAVPLLPDGTVPAYSEVDHDIGAISYFALNEFTLIVFVIIGSIGCIRALARPRQPLSARISVGFLLLAGSCILIYTVTGLILLTKIPVPQDETIQGISLFGTILCFLASVLVGGTHRLIILSRRRTATSATTSAIEPLWRLAVSFYPQVVLPLKPQSDHDKLTRMAIETNEALSLLRRNSSGFLEQFHAGHETDPRATAHLLVLGASVRHLDTLSAVNVSRLERAARLLNDPLLTPTLLELYAVRNAVATRDFPAPHITTHTGAKQ